jgi:hypothetical protein
VNVCSLESLSRSGCSVTERYEKRLAGTEEAPLPEADLEAVLGPTLGLLLDQEQIVDLAMIVGGFSPEEAERFRREICRPEIDAEAAAHRGVHLASWRIRFVAAAVDLGIPEKRAEWVFQSFVQAGPRLPSRSQSISRAIRLQGLMENSSGSPARLGLHARTRSAGAYDVLNSLRPRPRLDRLEGGRLIKEPIQIGIPGLDGRKPRGRKTGTEE